MRACSLTSIVGILSRHLLTSFLLPFSYLIGGLIAIWLVVDLANYLNDFLEAHVPISGIVNLYWRQLPSVLVQMLPVSLLLALLYSIIRLAQANELLAMSGSGVSLASILAPFLGCGLALSAVVALLNYKLAPQAEGAKGRLVAELTNGRDGDGRLKLDRYDYVVGHLYANRRDARLWYIQRFSKRSQDPLKGVQITQLDADGTVVGKFDTPSATYDPVTHLWRLEKPRIVRLDKAGDLISERFPAEELINDWSETPSRIGAATMQAQYLSVPELQFYLAENADSPDSLLAPFRTALQDHFALPFLCVLLVLVAAPLSMSHARRGVIAGVAAAILIFFAYFFLNRLFLALGQGARISPFWAAWTQILLLLAAGLVLLRRRSLHHDRLFTSWRGLRHFFVG